MDHDLSRLRQLVAEEKAMDFEHGKNAGIRWAVEHADPKLMRALRLLRNKKISSARFLHEVINRDLLWHRGNERSFWEMFENHLDSGTFYSRPFLSGFVEGAAQIWDEVKAAKGGYGLPALESNACAADSAPVAARWHGWFRGDRSRPWMQVIEGETEIQVIEKLMASSITGDKMALPAGQHPDQFNGEQA